MAYTLFDVMAEVEDAKTLSVIKRVLDTSPMLGLFEVETTPQGQHTFYREGDLPNPGYVNYGAAASDSAGAPSDPITTQLRKMSMRIPIDSVLADRATRTGEPYKQREVERHIRAAALNWKKYIVGRSPSAGDPQGLYGWVDQWNSTYSGNTVTFSATGSTVASAGSAVLMSKMDELRDAVYQPDFFLASRNIIRQIRSHVESGASTEKFANRVSFADYEFAPGMVTRGTLFWDGIPMISPDEDASETVIMAADEDPGDAGNDTTSIVAVRTGMEGVVLLQEYPQMFKIREFDESGLQVVEIDAPNAVEVRHPRACAKLFGFLEA